LNAEDLLIACSRFFCFPNNFHISIDSGLSPAHNSAVILPQSSGLFFAQGTTQTEIEKSRNSFLKGEA